MKKSAILLFAVATISTTSFGCTLQAMDKAQLTKAVVNNTLTSIPTVNLDDKAIQNTVTVFLDDKGHVHGTMAHKLKNAPQKDEGTYVINPDGGMKITWQHWDHAKPLDVHFFDTKNAYIVITNDNAFHTAFMKSEIHSGNHLK